MNKLLLDALHCRNHGNRPPVWLMRQAGRYMPEYRALRQKYSFMEMCRVPDLIAEITQMPIKAFGMDGAILFSDILVVAEAMGVGLHFEEGVGPVIERPLRVDADIDRLRLPPVADVLGHVAQGIRLVKPALKVPLIGFCGAPFTVASYMIEGASSTDLKRTKQWMFQNPRSFHRLLQTIADYTLGYLRMQINAGVQAIQIFDTWANFLAFPQFCEYSFDYLRQIMEGLSDTDIPIILFCRGSAAFAKELACAKPSAISVDWNCDLATIAQDLPKNIALQGNLDPDVLYAPVNVIESEVLRIIREMQGHPGFIFNLGHGIKPDTPYDAVKVLVQTVKESSSREVMACAKR